MTPRPSKKTREVAEPRAGTCALVGRPNVGKSTLLNKLVGEHVAIATPTPQTTRARVLGVMHVGDPPTQIGFLDTPGLHAPRNALGQILNKEAVGALEEADVVVVVTDVPTGRERSTSAIRPGDELVFESVRRARGRAVLAINKVDRLRDKTALLPMLAAYAEAFPFEALVPVSATRVSGLDRLVTELRKLIPEGRLYEDDVLTDRPERWLVGELVREAVILSTRQELPHAVAVTVESWVEPSAGRGSTRIEATIHVEKPGQKAIVIGAGGEKLRSIGEAARLSIEKMLGRRVYLGLRVRLSQGWTRDPEKARRFGVEGQS